MFGVYDEYERSRAADQAGRMERVECVGYGHRAANLGHEFGHGAGLLACEQQVENLPGCLGHQMTPWPTSWIWRTAERLAKM